MDIGGVEAGCRQDVRVHRRAECQMAAEADAHYAEPAGTVIPGFQVVQGRPGIRIVRRDLLRYFVRVAFVRAGLIVGKDRSSWLEFMVDLRNNNQVTVPGDQRCRAPDWPCDLKDLRVKDDAWIFALRRRAEDERMHRTGRRLDFGIFFPDCHVLKCINLPPNLHASRTNEPHAKILFLFK